MIQMVLKGLGNLEIQAQPPLCPHGEGPDRENVYRVLACAVCRTDAKMWEQGHRDLVFPRVLGHEMVVADGQGRRYAVWPGKSCGRCSYCTSGKENLCDGMKITGFHTNGGFAHQVLLSEASLIPLPGDMDIHTACFAEPVGCVVNAFDKLPLSGKREDNRGRRLLIYGGGTMGLIIALYARHQGLAPLILEKDAAKIQKISPILKAFELDCVKETRDSLFDLVITACPDYIALCQALTKVDKGGSISFFSGLTKNETIETNLFNLVHYKEATITGAYGMKKSDMERGLGFMAAHPKALGQLIEAVVEPEQAVEILPRVLKGRDLKYILDFSLQGKQRPVPEPSAPSAPAALFCPDPEKGVTVSPLISDLISRISPLSPEIEAGARAKMDEKTKPLGALGKLEALSVRICAIQKTLTPSIGEKGLLVFAGDHGITEEGVSAFPSEVTGQMVDNFLNNGAAINVLCHHHNIRMRVVDMGVKKEFAPHPRLIRAKVAQGTRNMAMGTAMTRTQAMEALENGARAFFSFYEEHPVQILGLGEMGIGNTTSASALICAITGISPGRAAGRGTGMDDEGLSHKTKVIQRILDFHLSGPGGMETGNGLALLRAMGGFELGGMAGAAIAAASKGCAIVLDGVISTAAGLIAHLLAPGIEAYFIAGHKSVEKAHEAALAQMGLDPVLDLSMRLGEGTGAALTIDLAQAACALMNEMASFDEAKISRGINRP